MTQFDPYLSRLAASGRGAFSQLDEEQDQDNLFVEGLKDIPRGIAGGTIGFAQSLGDIADTGAEFLGGDLIDDELLTAEARPDWAKTNTIFGGLVSGFTEGALGFIPVAGVAGRASKAIRGISAVSRLAEAGRGVGFATKLATSQGAIGGILVDAYAFRGDEGRLSDVFVEMGGLGDNPVTRWLSTEEDDSWITGRAKNAVEGLFLGIGFDAMIEPVMRAMKGKPDFDAEALFQDPKGAAERGLIPPDVAERLGNATWVSENFKLEGPARTQFAEQLKSAVGDDNVSTAALNLSDAYAKMYAASKGVTLDEAYSKMYAGVTNELSLTSKDLKQPLLSKDMQSSPFLSVLDSLPKNSQKKNNLKDVQVALWKQITGDGDFINTGDYSPENRQKLAGFLTEELKAADTGPLADKSRGWYNRRFSMAIQAVADTADLPTVASDPGDRFMFTALTAIFSQGKTPTQNLDNAIRATKEWIDGGRKSVAAPSWFSDDKIQPEQFTKLQKVVEMAGGDTTKANELMLKEISVGELNKLGFDVAGELVEAKLPFSTVLGPKIGAFFANLAGHSGALTMDLWWMRTVRRGTGDFAADITPESTLKYTKEGYKAGLDKAKAAGKLSKGSTKLSLTKAQLGDIEYLKTWYKEPARAADRKGFKNMTADEWLANRLKDQFDPTTAEEPGSGSNRQFMRDAFNDALKTYNETSGRPPLTAADAQAVLWHHEKNLWKDTFKVIPRDGGDFFDSAVTLARSKGVQIDEARYNQQLTPDRNARPGDGSTGGADAGADGSTLLQGGTERGVNDAQPGLFGDAQQSAAGPRGAVRFADDGRALVALFKSADASTVVHELGHVFRRNLSEISPDLQAAADAWAGVKPGARWTRPQEEKWAETFEKYLANGEAPTPELKSVFEKFSDWIKSVYRGIVGGPMKREVPPEIRNVFDAMLGSGWNRSEPSRTKPLNIPPNTPSEYARGVRERHMGGKQPELGKVKVDPKRAMRIADAYEEMKHAPDDPKVVESYNAMIEETAAQYKTMEEMGVKIIPWANTGEPYGSSQEMVNDVQTNNRLYFLKTLPDEGNNYGSGSNPDKNPLLGDSGIVLKDSKGANYRLTHNDVFRAVHDFFGHATEGYQFGPEGEENAWRAHSRMYSEKARPAMSSETRGQNSWVNYNNKLRRPDGSVPKRTDPDFVPLKDRPFAEQKTGLLPDWAWKEGIEDPVELSDRVFDTYMEAAKANQGDLLAAAGEALRYHINFNHLNLDSPTDTWMRAVDKVTQHAIDNMIGDVRTLKEIRQAALQGNVDPNKVMVEVAKLASATRAAAETMVRSRIAKVALAKTVSEKGLRIAEMRKVKGRGMIPVSVAEDFYKALDTLERFDTIHGVAQKQIARAVTSGNIDVGIDDIRLDPSATPKGGAAVEAMEAAIIKMAQAEGGNGEISKAARKWVNGAKQERKAQAPRQPRQGAQGAPTEATTQTPTVDTPAAPAAPDGAPAIPGAPTQAAPTAAPVRTPQAPTARAAAPQAPASGAPEFNLTPDAEKRLIQLIEDLSMADLVGQSERTLRNIKNADKAGKLEMLMEVQKASILSGIPTLVLNATTGGANILLQPIARTLGALVEMDPKGAREGFRLLYNTAGAFGSMFNLIFNTPQGVGPRGVRTMKEAFTNERSHLTGSIGGMENRGAIRSENFNVAKDGSAAKAIDITGKFVRIPFMVNQSVEEFWQQTAYLGYVRTQALDAADKAIWDNADIPSKGKPALAAEFVDNYVKQAFDNMGRASHDGISFKHEDAVRYAKTSTFSQDLVYGFGKWLQDGKSKFPLLDLVIPFIKVPTNLLRTTIRYTPGLNLLQERTMAKFLSRSPEEVARAKGEMLLGVTIWAYAGYLAASGQVTGGGPQSKAERDALLATGWRPYSFQTVDENGKTVYTEFRRFDPMASILGLAADFGEIGAYVSEGERDKLAAMMTMALANNVSSKTYLQGISEVARAMTGGTNAESLFRNKVASFVPNALARGASADDDYMREVRSVMDAIKRRVPGYSETLAPRRNVLGEPVTPPSGYLPFTNTLDDGTGQRIARMTSPIGLSQKTSDLVKNEMANLAHGFSMPAKSVNGVDLTLVRLPSGQDAYDRLVELSGTVELNGKTLQQSLEDIISSDSYTALPEPEGRSDNSNPRIKVISRVISSYRRLARQQLYQEMPELRQMVLGKSGNSLTARDNPVLQALNR